MKGVVTNQGFFSKWSSSMAYVLGFFAADGNMLKSKQGAFYIGFYSSDRDVIVMIRDILGSNHAIGRKAARRPTHKDQYRLQIGSKTIFDRLIELGFTPKKSLTLIMPDVPAEFVGDFVRGYFDGDGCVYFKKLKFADRKRPRWILQAIFTCGNKRFLIDFLSELRRRGIKGGSIRNKLRGFDLLLSHKDSLAIYKLMYHNAPATDLYLRRKYVIFRRAIEILYPDAVVV